MEANNYAYECDVTSSGMYGHCDYCHRYPPSTTEVSGARLCWNCFHEKYPGVQAEFQVSDATFKCLGEYCEEESLSYRQYIAGSCCSVALNFTVCNVSDTAFFEITKLYKESRREQESAEKESMAAEEELEDAENEVEKIRKSLIKAKATVKFAKRKANAAEKNLKERRNWSETVRKRALVVANDALGYDVSSHDACEIKKEEEETEMHECRLCYNPYGDERPEAVVIPCGYKACFNCLSTLPRKVCPHCRAEFTDDKLLKLH
ncbi:Oidioi.mRNA.OKI2018_I69.XSR.g13917.t1.cds [Oikopleura dioica]|uniref:Oidioi.mRNA.OKI2018_I69.XSR.g13917.t1.cds n=1 Tax=Oikopleura dioica TaxID=34765 RepID=A0ABN7SD31_OIKDI|nr:Oidioi.mRNA.OKI2018_I69.XSR.g13917.t1.cds [Oikopleura dioica]